MSVLMWFHAALAVVALGLGPALFLRPKGTRAHRLLGFAYVAAMLMVAISGILITVELGRASIFLLFSAIVLVSIPAGMWAIWRAGASQQARHLEGHFYAMSWSYAGLLLAGAASLRKDRRPAGRGWLADLPGRDGPRQRRRVGPDRALARAGAGSLSGDVTYTLRPRCEPETSRT